MVKNYKKDFTIPKELLKQLDDYTARTMVPRSRLIAKLLKEFFEKEEKNNSIILTVPSGTELNTATTTGPLIVTNSTPS
jgi:hypothetical protein